MRSLREIYEQIEEDGEANIFCLYVDHEPLTFQEAKERRLLVISNEGGDACHPEEQHMGIDNTSTRSHVAP